MRKKPKAFCSSVKNFSRARDQKVKRHTTLIYFLLFGAGNALGRLLQRATLASVAPTMQKKYSGHSTNFIAVAPVPDPAREEGGGAGATAAPPPPYQLFSVTPKIGSIAGSQTLVLRGKQFLDRELKVEFRGWKNSLSAKATKVHFVNRSLIEISCPPLYKFAQQAKKFVTIHVACAGRTFSTNKVGFKFLDKCPRVRRCLKEKGHGGRCCADEGPPIYATQEKILLPNGGRFSTALVGRRTRPIKKNKDSVPQYGVPKRPEIPGGNWGTALVGTRTKKIAKDTNSVPLGGPPQPNAVPGGHISTAYIGKRCAPVKKRDDTVPIYGLPKRAPTPGGKIGTAGLGYRTKKPSTLHQPPPVQPPPKPKVLHGGRFSTALVGRRTEPIKKREDAVPQYGQPPRPPIPGGGFGNAMVGYRTKGIKKDPPLPANHSVVELPMFGHGTPGGHFNMHGADREGPIKKRPDSAPMYRVKGCGEQKMPGGRFNMEGSHKAMFRYTYLDESATG
jgi:hypothetical protein